MKKTLIYIFVAVALITTSCKKVLEQIPGDAQPGDQVLKSSANVNAILAASYERFVSNDFMGGLVVKTSELYGDQIDFTNVTGGAEVQFKQRGFSTFNGIGRSLWFTGYEAIGRANVVLKALAENTYPDITLAVNDRWKGEALFIRGASHFELTRLFAKPFTNNPSTDPGVVVRQKALTAEEAQIALQRNTVRESYDAAIADLKQAELLLPATNGGVRVNRFTAKAYLARIYFNMADYVNARLYANDVIANSGYSLGTNVTTPFSSTAAITAPVAGVIQMLQADGGTLRGTFWSLDINNTYLPLNATTASIISSKGGTRSSLLTANTPAPVRTISLKWSIPTLQNTPIIRLAEMYLIRAEASVQNGTFTDAAVRADVNALRTVAGLAADNTTTGAAALLTLIRTERVVELFTEGDGYHELRRLKLNVRGIPFNDASGLLKIPDGEVRANLGMIQN